MGPDAMMHMGLSLASWARLGLGEDDVLRMGDGDCLRVFGTGMRIALQGLHDAADVPCSAAHEY